MLRLGTRLNSGEEVSHALRKDGSDAAFQPFGRPGTVGSVFFMELAAEGTGELFGRAAAGSALCIGVRVQGRERSLPADDDDIRQAVQVSIVTDGRRRPAVVKRDTTLGFVRTGVIAIDAARLPAGVTQAVLEFTLTPGAVAAPPILRIEPNVIPVIQRERIDRELHVANGWPHQTLKPERQGLMYEGGPGDVVVEVEGNGTLDPWMETPDLRRAGPHDRCYVFDRARGEIHFGNGVNGALPQPGRQVLLSYAVSGGAEGNIRRNRNWAVTGLAGVAGVNIDPVAGGRDAETLDDLRRSVRTLRRTRHILATAQDIEEAALALPFMEVARARVIHQPARAGDAFVLVAMAKSSASLDLPADGENRLWLAALQDALARRLPLAARLRVVAPDFVPFVLEADLVGVPQSDPAAVRRAAETELRRRLSLTNESGSVPWDFGAGLNGQEIAGWLLRVPGVSHVARVRIITGAGEATALNVPASGLPRLGIKASRITVNDRPRGASR